MESVSCRIKEVTQISVNVYFLKFWVVPPYLSLHVATFPGRPLQYQQSILMFRVGIVCSAQGVQVCRVLHSMLHSADFKQLFSQYSQFKKKTEKIFCCKVLLMFETWGNSKELLEKKCYISISSHVSMKLKFRYYFCLTKSAFFLWQSFFLVCS